MKRICVYCGSSPGAQPEYIQAARQLSRTLVSRNIGLVYGGASVGAMGEIAKAVIEANGDVIGVIPRDLAKKEVAFTELTDLRIVDSMHERKALMVELSDGFIALPGGLGTFEEFFEVLTWAQLGLHTKPCGLLNVRQYFTKLMDFLDHAVAEQFVRPEYRSMVLIDENSDDLLKKFKTYEPPKIDKASLALLLTNNTK
ncbi:TIGR00730 family Rossman fold protein [Chloroflexota bacterium]